MDGEELKKSLDNSNEKAELQCGLTEKIERLQLDNKKLVATCAALERLKQEKEDFEKQLQNRQDMLKHPLRYIMDGIGQKVYAVAIGTTIPPVGTCGKCKNGWIYYTSQQGIHVKEKCRCSAERQYYYIKPFHLARIEEGEDGLILMYDESLPTKAWVKKDDDLYHGEPFKDVFMTLTYFADLDKCREYMECLNENRPLSAKYWPIDAQEKPYDEE